MAKKPAKVSGTKPAHSLAKLHRLYGHQHIQRDVFGRRLALPSEVANLLRTRNQGPTGKP